MFVQRHADVMLCCAVGAVGADGLLSCYFANEASMLVMTLNCNTDLPSLALGCF